MIDKNSFNLHIHNVNRYTTFGSIFIEFLKTPTDSVSHLREILIFSHNHFIHQESK